MHPVLKIQNQHAVQKILFTPIKKAWKQQSLLLPMDQRGNKMFVEHSLPNMVVIKI